MVSSLEYKFDVLWNKLHPNIDLETEVKLIPKRRFRFDYVHKKSMIAVEINGQIWRKGGHSSGKGLLRDYEKLNLAQAQGFVVFQLAGCMITPDWLNIIAHEIKKKAQ